MKITHTEAKVTLKDCPELIRWLKMEAIDSGRSVSWLAQQILLRAKAKAIADRDRAEAPPAAIEKIRRVTAEQP